MGDWYQRLDMFGQAFDRVLRSAVPAMWDGSPDPVRLQELRAKLEAMIEEVKRYET